ncbi:polysaccharide biosynthesis tyrosine autokinase [Hydrogenimonas urashimensis]|uniref:polysaccharide biosynthesis tyrosine autokinase n=1 Tax=Hydrogenimonas urashimensis TaxID=2740515 RepID=UPI00191680E2|nr:polysaccharide biosynthesis tyrosine autokinase [Hydrogenimonas urashimensis]
MATETKHEIDEDEIDIKEIFDTLKRYKISIVVITLLLTLGAALYAYVAPSIYQAKAYIEVQEDENGPGNMRDFLAMASSGVGANINNVIDTFQMPHIGLKALEQVTIGIRYYLIKNFRKRELYRNSPFVVIPKMTAPNALRSTFKIFPINEESFRLVVEPSLKEKIADGVRGLIGDVPPEERPFSYDHAHNYGEEIDSQWFSLTVQKVYDPADGEYAFTLTPNPMMLGFIQQNLSVAPLSKEGTIVEISFLDPVPQRAKEIVNALINAYMGESIDLSAQSAQKKLKFLDEQLAAINKALQGSAEKLQEFKSSHIITKIGQKATLTAEKISELQRQLYEIDMRLSVLKNLLEYLKTHRNIKGINVETMSASNPTITSLILKIQELYAQRDTLLASVTESHPDVVKVTKELESLRHSLIESIKSSIRGLENRKQSLLGIIEENEKELQALPEEERKLAQLNRNFMVNEKIYNYLLEKRAETAIVAASAVPKVRVAENAFVGERPVKPKRGLIIVLGVVLGLILGIAFAFLRNFLDDTIKSAEGLERLTKIPLYGVVPHFTGRKNISAFHEALRVIRTNLEFLQNKGSSKVITITSTVPKEGKSSIVTELGKIIAKSGKRVILLDLDLRRARVHQLFRLANERGVSTLLVNKSTLKESVQYTQEKGFHVITAGPTPPNPSELLMSKSFRSLIASLQSEYDYILLDSPPIGVVSDAMAPMRISDITLFVMRADYSKKAFLKNINWLAAEYDITAGIILNDVKVSAKKGAYGFAYGANYGYSNKYYV